MGLARAAGLRNGKSDSVRLRSNRPRAVSFPCSNLCSVIPSRSSAMRKSSPPSTSQDIVYM